MVKKIKFPLELENGAQVRTIEQLRENFNIEKVVEYFISGKLKVWLEDRYYEEEAEKIENLNINSPLFKKYLCEALGVEYKDDDLDINEIEKRNEKIKKLLQYTEDKSLIEKIDHIAFDQEDLSEILDGGAKSIYLCGEKYSIPLIKRNITYVGISNPIIKINSLVDIDLDSIGIVLKDLTVTSNSKIKVKSERSSNVKYEDSIVIEDINKESLKLQNKKLNEKWSVYLKERKVYSESGNGTVDYDGKIYNTYKSLYKSKEDGSCEELIDDTLDNIKDFSVFENNIVYVFDNGEVYKKDLNNITVRNEIMKFKLDWMGFLSGSEKRLLLNDKWLLMFEQDDVWVRKIIRANYNGEGAREVCNDRNDRITSVLYDNYLYYVKMYPNDGELVRVDLRDLSKISIDYNVYMPNVYKDNLYYVKYDGKSGENIYESALNGDNKKVLVNYYKYNHGIKSLEFKENVLWYETSEKGVLSNFIGIAEKHKIQLDINK